MSNTIMSISLKLPPGISLEFTPQGASLKIPEDMLLMFRDSVNDVYDVVCIDQEEERDYDEWNIWYRDHMVGDTVGEGLIVCQVDPSFWNYAIEKNGGELVLDSGNNRWDPQLGESYHPDCIFSIDGGDGGDDMGGLWKLPKFTPAHPVLRKGQIELDKAVVDISKCIKLEPTGFAYDRSLKFKERNKNFVIEFEQFMNK